MDFSPEPIESSSSYSTTNMNWVFIVDWILVLVLSLGMIFYFNRFIGYIVTSTLKILMWKWCKIRINIDSLKISFLGGRVFVKNLTLMTPNETISILKINFTWRYWLTITRKSEYTFFNMLRDEEQQSIVENEKLPSRFGLIMEGLEIFMYNRSGAYDIIAETLNLDKDKVTPEHSFEHKLQEDNSPELRQRHKEKTTDNSNFSTSTSFSENSSPMDNSSSHYVLSTLIRFLPVDFYVKKGAFVVGNDNTASIMVASFTTAQGSYDIGVSPNPLDSYRTNVTSTFYSFHLSLKPNLSYKGPQVPVHSRRFTAAANVKLPNSKRYKLWKKFTEALKKMNTPLFLKNVSSGNLDSSSQFQWTGLKQYIGDDDTANFEDFDITEEYAKYSTILDAETFAIRYYFDAPGLVSIESCPTNIYDGPDIGNGGSPPLIGMYVNISQSTIHYGPWAERQRVSLHNMLFPTLCRDSTVQSHLSAGNVRSYTSFKLTVEVDDESIIRLPTRESSKDAAFIEEQRNQNLGSVTRPFGWIELKIDSKSYITVDTRFVCTESGWRNSLNMWLNKPELRSSVNHDIFFKADEHSVEADIGYPLKWNGLAHWDFINESKNAHTFFLREHITLVSDFFTDFAGGAPTPYERYRPFRYSFSWRISNFSIYLNINDCNIINNPLDFNDNTYLSFQGEELDISVVIPLEGVYQKSNTITYSLETSYFNLVLDSPPWHTARGFLTSNVVGKSHYFTVKGSYTYFSEIELNACDHIVINCISEDTTLITYGNIIRYIMLIIDNYFGDNIHFKTLEEYTGEKRRQSSDQSTVETVTESPHKTKKIVKTENEYDVLFSFCVKNGCIVLPYHLYDCSSHISLNFSTLDIDIRFTNYYMDLQADLSPIKSRFVEDCDETKLFEITKLKENYDPDMCIDSLSIHGHRMFGLPPTEPTYFCKWDFVAGKISIDSEAKFLSALSKAGKVLGFGYSDLENALIIEPPKLFDVTSISFVGAGIHVKINNKNALKSSIEVEMHPITFSFNDLANNRYSSRTSLKIPTIILKVLNESNKMVAGFETSLIFTNFCQKRNFSEHRKLQQQHIRTHDAPFHRCPFLISEDDRAAEYMEDYRSIKPSYSLPPVSIPLKKETVDYVYKNTDKIFDVNSILSDSASNSTSSNEDETSEDEFSSGFNEPISSRRKRPKVFERMPSFCSYDDADFTPNYDIDEKYEYDNLVVDLSEIRAFLTPSSLKIFFETIRNLGNDSVDSLMDNLQIDVTHELQNFRSDDSSMINFKFVTPSVSIKYGDFRVDNIDDAFFNEKMVACVEIDILGPSIAFNYKNTNSLVPSFHDSQTAIHEKGYKSAVQIKMLSISLSKDSTSNPESRVINASFDDFEFWVTDGDQEEFISSSNLRTLDIFFHPGKLDWLMSYVTDNQIFFESLSKEIELWAEKNNRKDIELIYLISKASAEYKIEHDPSVLTKPSYIIRSSKDHVRANDSWKVVARLRHVYNSLPIYWQRETNKRLKEGELKAPASALDEVLLIFSRWRSWEFSDIQHSYVFRHVFRLPSAIKKERVEDKKLQLSVESLVMRIFCNAPDDDYICLDYLDLAFYLSNRKETNVIPLNINLSEKLLALKFDFNLESYRSKLSYHLLDFIPVIEKMKNSTTGVNATTGINVEPDEGKKTSKNISLQSTILIQSFDQVLEFKNSSVVQKGSQFSISCLGVYLGDLDHDMPFSVATNLGVFENAIRYEDKTIFLSTMKEGSIVVASVGNLVLGSKVIDCYAKSCTFKGEAGTETYVDFLNNILDEELVVLEKHFPSSQAEVNSSVKTEMKAEKNSIKLPENVYVVLKIDEIEWILMLLSPLKVKGTVESTFFTVKVIDRTINLYTSFANILTQIEATPNRLVKLETADITLQTSIKMNESSVLVQPTVRCGLTKILVPQIEETLFVLLSERREVETKFQSLNAVKQRYQHKFEEKEAETAQKIEPDNSAKSLYYKLELVHESTNLSFFMGGTKFSTETKDLSISLLNFSMSGAANEITELPMHGRIHLPNNSFSIFDRSIAVGLSKVLNFHFDLKIIDLESLSSITQTLQVESKHCRICLNPYSLFKMITFVEKVSVMLNKFSSETVVTDNDDNSSHSSKIENSSDTTVDNLLSHYSIQVLSYNFCIGWIFIPGKNKGYPGIIAGCEKVFVAHEKGLGKLTILQAYLSVAKGSDSSNFFSTSTERDSLNRAFLPKVQTTFATRSDENTREINVNVSGEALDAKFLSTSMIIVEKTITSIILVRDFLDKRSSPISRKSSVWETNTTNIQSKNISIECVTSFDGGTVLLYRLDSGNGSVTPSLNLHAPAVKIMNSYIHNQLSIKKHNFKMEVLTSSSDNTLYSTCVPVFTDIMNSFKFAMKESASRKVDKETKSTKTDSKSSSKNIGEGFNIGSLLVDTDIQIGIRIEKQNLALSCEPTAKVQALVGIGGIYLRINTCDDSSKLIGVLTVDDINASLQHIYSREVSGSITIHHLVETFGIDFSEVTMVTSSGSVSTVTSYVNLKQYQDLDLFKDVWSTHEIYDTVTRDTRDTRGPKHATDIVTKNIATRVREVSSTTAMPWIISFIITDVSLKVDLGQSLGTISLDLDRFWAFSKKSVTWDQSLKLGFDTISLSSEGRLSGDLIIKNIRLHSAITWKLADKTFDNPLVLLSSGIESLQLKSGFDYHIFLLANIEDLSLNVFNQRDDTETFRDTLISSANCERIEVYMTTFTASTAVDIYNTLIRMFQDSKRSYKEVLRDSNTNALEFADGDNGLKLSGKLRTEIEVTVNKTIVQIYPSSLCDSQVLAIYLGETNAIFSQDSIETGLENKLDLKLNDLQVALSSFKFQFPEDSINSCAVMKFVQHSRDARGGTIFVFPSLSISMSTFEKYDSNIIEYFYQSNFGGKVDVRWNLGSVNFIREMYSTHEKAFSSRTINKFRNDPLIKKEEDIKPKTGNDLGKLIDKVENKSKYTYVPLATPVIELPQLKELGDATPPLEWFGLHRKKFPDATHQIVIVGLQKMVHEVETQYSKILGKA